MIVDLPLPLFPPILCIQYLPSYVYLFYPSLCNFMFVCMYVWFASSLPNKTFSIHNQSDVVQSNASEMKKKAWINSVNSLNRILGCVEMQSMFHCCIIESMESTYFFEMGVYKGDSDSLDWIPYPPLTSSLSPFLSFFTTLLCAFYFWWLREFSPARSSVQLQKNHSYWPNPLIKTTTLRANGFIFLSVMGIHAKSIIQVRHFNLRFSNTDRQQW